MVFRATNFNNAKKCTEVPVRHFLRFVVLKRTAVYFQGDAKCFIGGYTKQSWTRAKFDGINFNILPSLSFTYFLK